jgi:hypothetical protein
MVPESASLKSRIGSEVAPQLGTSPPQQSRAVFLNELFQIRSAEQRGYGIVWA